MDASLASRCSAQRNYCEANITAAPEVSRTTRGTKRVCLACEVRFYDLARDPIVCPSCGALFTVTATPTVAVGTPPTSKTGWRSRGLRRPKPALPVEDPEESAPESSQDAVEVAPGPEPEDDLVLEQEQDDAEADVIDLVGRDVAEPKER